MKKILSVFLIILLLATVMAFTVHADMGEAEFDDWYVYVGLDGYRVEGEKLEPGLQLRVHSMGSDEESYILLIEDDKYKGGLYTISVSESDLQEYFTDGKRVVPKTEGTKLDKIVKCKVTAKPTLVLRKGPAVTYHSILNIPTGAKISYQYTYEYGDLTWGYVEYKGEVGWACIESNLIEVISTESVEETEEYTEEDEETEEDEKEVALPDNTRKKEVSDNKGSFFSSTKNVIIVCCLAAAVLVLTAIIILLIILKTKKNKQPNYPQNTPNYYQR
ncbi:MAG: hypothetical protein K5761_03390 [Clostridiales bacterium]|nr:hypothetical protein [Clostridiales bacterium]